jgi:hypothetical protein
VIGGSSNRHRRSISARLAAFNLSASSFVRSCRVWGGNGRGNGPNPICEGDSNRCGKVAIGTYVRKHLQCTLGMAYGIGAPAEEDAYSWGASYENSEDAPWKEPGFLKVQVVRG